MKNNYRLNAFLALFSIYVLTSISIAFCQSPAELLWDTVKAGASGSDQYFKPTLTAFFAPIGKANGSAVLICPGGGYVGLASDYEGDDVAKKFTEYGVTAFVLRYRRSPGFIYPVPIDDGKRAMRMIYNKTKQLNLDTNRIGIMGFSAGGHLASTVSTHYDLGNKLANDSVDKWSCKPAFSILIYPVISMNDNLTHSQSKQNLLGNSPDPALVLSMSNELQVKATTPPAFLVHTRDDPAVKYMNSQLYYDECLKQKIPARLLLFDHGPHGFGMATGLGDTPNLPELAVWPDSCAAWLKKQGFFAATVTGIGDKNNSQQFKSNRNKTSIKKVVDNKAKYRALFNGDKNPGMIFDAVGKEN